MLEKFTKDEIEQIRRELKELENTDQTKRVLTKQSRTVFRDIGLKRPSKLISALYLICDNTLGNYTMKLTARDAGHVYYQVRNTFIKTDVEKYTKLFEALVDLIAENYDAEACERAESKTINDD